MILGNFMVRRAAAFSRLVEMPVIKGLPWACSWKFSAAPWREFIPLTKACTGNGTCFIVIDPSAFCPLDVFRQLMDETVAYMKSSSPAPGVAEVLVPGELEFRTLRKRQQEGIPVDETTLEGMHAHGRRLGVDVAGWLAPPATGQHP